MNNSELLHERFIEALRCKIPQRGKLTAVLADILCIEKEAVYRRMRGEVPFSLIEAAVISRRLNLSLDHIVGANSQKSLPFQLKLTEFFQPNELDYAMHEEFIQLLASARNSSFSEIGIATSVIPLHFSIRFELIQRFYTLRWLYQFGKPGTAIPFSEIKFSDRMKGLYRNFLQEVEDIKRTDFIWDELLLFYITNDIKYFNSIRLISDAEVRDLKAELLRLLDHLDHLSTKGCFSNGNKVYMYVSSLNFETTYTYIHTDDYKLTLIKTFTLNETSSLDAEVFDKIKTWLQSLKRTAALISESDEKNRILFFERQRQYIETNLSS